MNKNEIKQIILEEIEVALQEMNENMSPEDMAADSRPEEGDEIEGPGPEDMPGAKVTPFVTDLEARIARAMETGDEDDLEDLAAGELDRAGLEEMARTANVFALAREASIKDVLGFMQRVNNLLKTYKSPGQKRPKKRFTPEEMKALAKIMLQDGGFTSKDIIAATSYNSPAQANKFLAALEQKGLIKLTSQLKKSMKPERDPNAPETRGRKAKSAEFDAPEDALDMDFGDFEDLDLGDIGALEENNNTMSELEKYIKQQIKEAKNPLAKKMKEIENQGRRAALETKLAAIDEMIEETEGRLTRIDEDNEFRDMMDKNAVKEVRKQLKELERAKAKLQKEYGKMKKMALPKNYDDEKGKVMDEDEENLQEEIDFGAVGDTVHITNNALSQLTGIPMNLIILLVVFGVPLTLMLGPELVDFMKDEISKFPGFIQKAIMKARAIFQKTGKSGEEINSKVQDLQAKAEKGVANAMGSAKGVNESQLNQFSDKEKMKFLQAYEDEYNVDVMESVEESYELNESTLRMQKLAGLITESDIKKKTKS